MHDQPHATAAAAVHDTRVTHVRPDRPVDVPFSFERQQSRVGITASLLSHAVMALIAVAIMRYAPEAQPSGDITPITLPDGLVFVPEEGPGGGGGGGGNERPEPPKQVELPGKEKVSVPVQPEPDPEPERPKEDPPEPPEPLTIPAKTMASATQMLPGAVFETAPEITPSQGQGTGGGGGTGTGTGSGPGEGSGLGPGTGGGFGGGAYRPGSGVTIPEVLVEVKPQYTADAMRAKVQGTVLLECVVLPDGTVGDVRITKSLDPVFGLDDQAVRAARRWRFKPGTRNGQPVPVLVTIELTFTLR
jgi:TonB family protein